MSTAISLFEDVKFDGFTARFVEMKYTNSFRSNLLESRLAAKNKPKMKTAFN
ncbi:MAG: hypothetical protein LBC53_05775 [Spirochaetaceae bacterium]|jgi:hypothetical protein|nr:hypothetical protein [Spirochaetaceae bacterium]